MLTRIFLMALGAALTLVALLNLLAASVHAATPGELLQKAIYTEETVGNLDEAMKLYEQVVAEGDSAQEAAAQAQYRLGLCHLKKGDDAAAKAAFESLVTNFPSAKTWVAKAQEHLSTALKLLPAPWKLGERLQLNMKLPTGFEIGTMIYMVDAAEREGQPITRCSSRGIVTVNQINSCSEVLCATDSFRPYSSLWKHSLLGEARAVYGENSAKITIVGKDKSFDIDFTPPAFDNEQAAELFRRLPLADGYKTTISIITSFGGYEIDLPVEVAGTESLTVPAGTFECFKLELGVVNQTFWVSTDEHRYIVRFAAGGISAELANIEHVEPGQPTSLDGENYSLSLPAGWLSYAPPSSDDAEDGRRDRVLLLDPGADADVELVVKPKDAVNKAVRESTKAWTEDFISDVKKMYPDLEVRSPGLSETTIGGAPATKFVANFSKDGKPMNMVGVAVLSKTNAASLRLTIAADKLDALRPGFDAIVNSFELK